MLRNDLVLAIFLLAATPSTGSAVSAKAKELNSEGFRLYKQNNIDGAAEKFARALAEDDNYALAHYNLACMLALFRARGDICEHDAYRSTIITHLRRAVELDPRRRSRLKEDPDLKSVHDTFGYQMLLGRKLSNPEDQRAILTAVSWYGPAPGVYGPMSGIDFAEDGKLIYWQLFFNDAGDVERRQVEGTWILREGRVHLHLKRHGRKSVESLTGSLDSKGVLKIDGLERFTDDPSDCSA